MADNLIQVLKDMGDIDIHVKQMRNELKPNQSGTELQKKAYEISQMTEQKFDQLTPIPTDEIKDLYFAQKTRLVQWFTASNDVSDNAPGSFEVS